MTAQPPNEDVSLREKLDVHQRGLSLDSSNICTVFDPSFVTSSEPPSIEIQKVPVVGCRVHGPVDHLLRVGCQKNISHIVALLHRPQNRTVRYRQHATSTPSPPYVTRKCRSLVNTLITRVPHAHVQ